MPQEGSADTEHQRLLINNLLQIGRPNRGWWDLRWRPAVSFGKYIQPGCKLKNHHGYSYGSWSIVKHFAGRCKVDANSSLRIHIRDSWYERNKQTNTPSVPLHIIDPNVQVRCRPGGGELEGANCGFLSISMVSFTERFRPRGVSSESGNKHTHVSLTPPLYPWLSVRTRFSETQTCSKHLFSLQIPESKQWASAWQSLTVQRSVLNIYPTSV